MAIYNLFVKHIDGKTLTLKFPTPTITGETLIQILQTETLIPAHHQLLISQGHKITSQTLISTSHESPNLFPTVNLLLRLPGGKGGFGSLLRGAATKAGQKKTNNFDACRDISGRRLRHVNAEKKLEEWKLEEEERRLEKMAEDFIKKKVKDGKKGRSSGDSEKYVEKYREESLKCMEVVERSVRESVGKLKRKGVVIGGSDEKKLKIWMGKKNMDESDSEDDASDEDEKNDKSAVLDGGSNSNTSKDGEGSSNSTSVGISSGELCCAGSTESGSEEEKETVVQRCSESDGSPIVGIHINEMNCTSESVSDSNVDIVVQSTSISGMEAVMISKKDVLDKEQETNATESRTMEEKFVALLPCASVLEEGGEVDDVSKSRSEDHEEPMVVSTSMSEIEMPLNFDDFNSAVEMEALGMERLKSELQTCGLKCGGTLQERAARLFLLKTTPLEKLPKKLLAKK
ncbi:Sde2, N-terminal ubiquitin domain [Dillenia turbinata]|uniref:Sde2, N-terminal ubiquitin domain n=1 Tax=Dillenia turbinata TaxID=194707 RepID=A0AAN8UYH0_9MAGN